MNQKELNEIRRRLAPDKSNIGKIYGCYVNTTGQIVARIDASTGLMPELEIEKYMGILRGALSGALGRNLLGLTFSMQQVIDSEEHRLLTEMRNCGLTDEALREKFYAKVISALNMDHRNYLILLAYDAYDVPKKRKDDSDGDSSETVFRYFVCAVCPVKDGKPELGYDAKNNMFRGYESEQIVSPPEIGFMFPSFEDRCANIHNALYFAKKPDERHDELIKEIFNTDVPMNSLERRDRFENVLAESLDEAFSYDVMQSLHEQLREKIVQHKETKDPEPLEVTPRDVCLILANGGVDDEKVTVFREKCEEEFGVGTALDPGHLIEAKKFELVTPQVKISVDPQYSCMVETRIIDGKKYILIPAGEGVEVNGVGVRINEEKTDGQ